MNQLVSFIQCASLVALFINSYIAVIFQYQINALYFSILNHVTDLMIKILTKQLCLGKCSKFLHVIFLIAKIEGHTD